MQAPSLGGEDPLEEGMATHSSILAWRIPWTEEPGRLQSMWLQESNTTECARAHTHTHTHTRMHTHTHMQSWTCFFFFNWSIIALQCYVSFCCTKKWISCMYICIPCLLSLPPKPCPIHPSGSSQNTEHSLCGTAASQQLFVLHMVVCMYQCYSPSSSRPPFPSVSHVEHASCQFPSL